MSIKLKRGVPKVYVIVNKKTGRHEYGFQVVTKIQSEETTDIYSLIELMKIIEKKEGKIC